MTTTEAPAPAETNTPTGRDKEHFTSPQDRRVAWCGYKFTGPQGPPYVRDQVECVVCMDLLLTLGSVFWYRTAKQFGLIR